MLRIIIAASALAVAGVVLTGLAAAALGSAKAAAKWPSAGRSIVGPIAARIGITIGVVLVAAGVAMGTWLIPLVDPLASWGVCIGGVLASAALVTWGAVAVTAKIELSTLINSPSPPRFVGHDVGPSALSTGTETWTPSEPTEHETAASLGSSSLPPESVVGQAPYPPAVDSHSTTSQREDAATQQGVATPAPPSPPLSEIGTPLADAPDPAIPGDALPGWVYIDAYENWYLVLSTAGGTRLMRLADFALIPVGELHPEDLTIAGSIEMTVWPTDTAPPDSGEFDSVPPSSGEFDSGQLGSALPDSAPPSSGELDESQPDSAQPDTGQLDATHRDKATPPDAR